MPSRNTLIWVGAAALAVVAAGAGAVVLDPSGFPRAESCRFRGSWPARPPSRSRRALSRPLPRLVQLSRRRRKRSGPSASPEAVARQTAAARARLRRGERRSLGRSGHRRPRGAERESRTARRRQDRRRGDRRRRGPVCHHPACARARRSQPLAWPRAPASGQPEMSKHSRGLGSRASKPKRPPRLPRRRPNRRPGPCASERPTPAPPALAMRTLATPAAAPRRSRRDPVGRGRRRRRALRQRLGRARTPPCVSISIRRPSPTPRRNRTAVGR